MPDRETATAQAILAASHGAPDAAERARLAHAIGALARRLAPNDAPPRNGDAAADWRALVVAADRLHGSGVVALGRLAFLSDGILAMLADEAHALRPERIEDGRGTAGAGDTLARLAASRQLREAVSSAWGQPLVPSLEALYEYDGAGAHVRTHVDGDGWEMVCHVLVAHETERGAGTSELIAHLPHDDEPRHIRLAVGESVLLRGRGTLHSWAPLGPRDRRTLAAIGFRPAS